MALIQLSESGQLMGQLIRWSGEVNLAVAKAEPCDATARMSRLALWLTLTFAFDGLVQQASKSLGTEPGFRARKDAEKHDPDVLVRLRLLSEHRGLDLSLPDPPGPPSPRVAEAVIERHFRLRNSWAHNLGVVTTGDPMVSPIAEWDGPQAWVAERGWSEFSGAVENLSQRILDLDASPAAPIVSRETLVVTAKLRLPASPDPAFDVGPQHRRVLLHIMPKVIGFCHDMMTFWHLSRRAYPLFRCRGDQLVGELLDEVWLQSAPAEGRAFDLLTGMKRAIEEACTALGMEGTRTRVEVADERVVFDEQIAEIGGTCNMPRLWMQVQRASEWALEDLRQGRRRDCDPEWYPWAAHIYDNIVSAGVS